MDALILTNRLTLRMLKKIMFLCIIAKRTPQEYSKTRIVANEDTERKLFESNKILVARVLVDNIPALKIFKKNVCKHIPHIYSKEMSEKSEVASLLLITMS